MRCTRLMRAASLAGSLLLGSGESLAGAFVFAGEANGIDVVTHPMGYDGSGGALAVTVCIDPAATDAAAMEMPIQNAIRTLNARVPRTGNVLLGGDNDVPTSTFDFESVALHELGHCVGLAHPNLGSESGLTGTDRDYTRSTDGSNAGFDLDDGDDDVIGSGDDSRIDDLGLNYFRRVDNDPFQVSGTVDATTYSRSTADLPAGDSYAAGASREAAAALGLADTEAVMHQGQFSDEAQRDLLHDDVAMLRLAEAGLDDTEGTADDYSLQLSYVGLTDSCDIVIDSTPGGSFARCSVGGIFYGANHIVINGASLTYNETYNWYFNQVSNATAAVPSLTAPAGLLAVTVLVGAGWARLARRSRAPRARSVGAS